MPNRPKDLKGKLQKSKEKIAAATPQRDE